MNDNVEFGISLQQKFNRLRVTLQKMEKVAIAYSGGVDSTFLMRVAYDALGDNALAILAVSDLYPISEIDNAIDYAHTVGFPIIAIQIDELQNPEFVKNSPERCYYCKKDIFGRIKDEAQKHGIEVVLHGANADDMNDFRPGQRAADELGVRAPLQELGFTKNDIRQISKELGLPTWDKPSFACLATRFPYGDSITHEALAMVGYAESILRDLGFSQFRVRHHGKIARIEVDSADLVKLMNDSIRSQVVQGFKSIGYNYITMDLEGYRTGSMNEVLQDNRQSQSS